MGGLVIKGFEIPGIAQDFQWGQWDRQRNVFKQFGLYGATVLDGLRTTREFSVPMKCYLTFVTQDDLEAYLLELEGWIGQVGQFQYFDPSEVLRRQFENVELSNVERGIHRWDADLGWWIDLKVMFTQLSPEIPEDQQDLNNPD